MSIWYSFRRKIMTAFFACLACKYFTYFLFAICTFLFRQKLFKLCRSWSKIFSRTVNRSKYSLERNWLLKFWVTQSSFFVYFNFFCYSYEPQSFYHNIERSYHKNYEKNFAKCSNFWRLALNYRYLILFQRLIAG